jgi:hypothetical protein
MLHDKNPVSLKNGVQKNINNHSNWITAIRLRYLKRYLLFTGITLLTVYAIAYLCFTYFNWMSDEFAGTALRVIAIGLLLLLRFLLWQNHNRLWGNTRGVFFSLASWLIVYGILYVLFYLTFDMHAVEKKEQIHCHSIKAYKHRSTAFTPTYCLDSVYISKNYRALSFRAYQLKTGFKLETIVLRQMLSSATDSDTSVCGWCMFYNEKSFSNKVRYDITGKYLPCPIDSNLDVPLFQIDSNGNETFVTDRQYYSEMKEFEQKSIDRVLQLNLADEHWFVEYSNNISIPYAQQKYINAAEPIFVIADKPADRKDSFLIDVVIIVAVSLILEFLLRFIWWRFTGDWNIKIDIG